MTMAYHAIIFIIFHHTSVQGEPTWWVSPSPPRTNPAPPMPDHRVTSQQAGFTHDEGIAVSDAVSAERFGYRCPSADR